MAVSLPYPQPDPATGVWDPFALLQNLKYLAGIITSVQTGQLMPVGGIIFVRAGTTCPPGFNVVATYNGRFLRFGATGGTTGAATFSATASAPTSTTNVATTTTTTAVASSTHLHTLTGSATPAFVDVLACEKA